MTRDVVIYHVESKSWISYDQLREIYKDITVSSGYKYKEVSDFWKFVDKFDFIIVEDIYYSIGSLNSDMILIRKRGKIIEDYTVCFYGNVRQIQIVNTTKSSEYILLSELEIYKDICQEIGIESYSSADINQRILFKIMFEHRYTNP